MLHDDIRGVGEILNETVCLPDGCKGLTVSISSHLILSRPSCKVQLLSENVREFVSRVETK